MVICNLDSAYKPWTKISVSSFLSPMSFVFSLDFVLDNSTKMSSQFQTHICPLCLLRGKKWFYQLDLTLSGSDCKVPQMVQCCGPGSEVTSYNIITLYRHWCKRLLFHFNLVPANVCARAVDDGPKIWSPATTVEDLGRVPGS